MVSLVSEQRMQNIIPFFQEGAAFEKAWLVRSTDADDPLSRFAQAWDDTREVLQQEGFTVESAEPAVSAYGIAQTRQVIAQLLEGPESDEVVVNFTGGTKCMSIGAYIAARDAQVIALYVDTANEKLVWFCPDDRVEEKEFNLKSLTVHIYLQANGKRVDKERTQQHALPESAYNAARELVGHHWPNCRETLEMFGRAISQGQDRVSANGVDRAIADLLLRHSLVQQIQGGWQATQEGRAFLTGKWLDAMVYVILNDSALFDDAQLELRLQGIENELDVLVTRKGQMAIIECKSGDLGGQTTLNKLQAIRTGFGTFARTFFVTSRDKDQVKKNFRERAREYGVREIVTAESLLQVAEIVRKRMRGTP